jgi:hypothetical protein
MAKYELANDLNGNPIDVPEGAVAWRVRRVSGKPGRPQTVYDPETGRQLEVPLDASIDDLRDCGCLPGRYRLDAVDGEGKGIAGVTAYTEISMGPEVPDQNEIPAGVARLLETVERQSDTICRVVEALAQSFGPLRPAVAAAPVEANAMKGDDVLKTVAGVGKLVQDMFKPGGNGTSGGGGALS